MAPESDVRMVRWAEWLPLDATDDQTDEVMKQWEQGAEPPDEPYYPEWPNPR